MPKPCTVCTHDEREQIDADLVAGSASQRVIAARYGVSKDAVRRHTAHISAALARMKSEREFAGPLSAMDSIRELITKANRVLDAADADGKGTLTLAAIRELRGLTELWARLTGELDERPQVQVLNVATHPEHVRMRTVLMEALAPYPDAGQAVARRLAELEISE